MLPIIRQILTGVVQGIGDAIEEAIDNNAKPKLRTPPVVNSKPNTEIPPMLKAMAPQSFETYQEPAKQQQKNFRSTSTLTMDRIVDTHTGGSNKAPVAANDPDIFFAGRPKTNAPDPTAAYFPAVKSSEPKEAANSNDVMFEGRYKTKGTGANKDGRNSHILSMFSGNGSKFSQHDNDNNPDAVVVSLEPILKNIDLNAAKMAEQLKEISTAIDKLLDAENGPFSKFVNREKEIEGRNTNRSEGRPVDSIRPNAEKSESFFDKFGKLKNQLTGAAIGLVGGGLTNGIGNFISGGDNRVSTQGGYGAREVSVNPNKTTNRSQTQMQLYQAFKKQGLSDEGARTMVAQVGRENNFSAKHLYGSHIDPHNRKTNAGMMSWQGERGNEFIKFMTEKGLFRNGKLAQGQESLNAQAEFAVREMQRKKQWNSILKDLKDPSKSYKDLEHKVGRSYVGWRYDDPKYHTSGMHNQNVAYSEIKSLSEGHSKGNPGSSNISIASSRKPSQSSQMANLSNDNKGTRVLAGSKPMNYAPSQISGARNGMGTDFSRASAQQSVTNNNTNITVHQSNSTQPNTKQQTASKEKRQIPPTRPMGYQDVWNKYFG